MSESIREFTFPSGQVLQIIQGDLTEEKVDAIVNAANSHLQHGGGVAGAISHRGGPQIQSESNDLVRRQGSVSHEKPVYTSAGKLPCRYVIHAVGPVWGEGDEDVKLAAAVRGSLHLADQLKLSSIAFPAISTGIFGFPKERAADVILNTISSYFTQNPDSGIYLVHITLLDRATSNAFIQVWNVMFD